MNLLQRAFQRFDLSSALDDASWSTGGNTYFGLGRPSGGEERASAWDFEAAVRFAYKRNGPIFALMLVRQLVFSEARFQFRQIRNGRPGELFGTQALEVLETPWTGGTTGKLLSRMIQDGDLNGNGFVTNYNPGRLKRMRPDWTIIVTGSEEEPHLAGDAIDGDLLGYGYAPQGNWDDPVFLLPEQVAHFAPIPDPEFQFRGMSWLTPVVREITADSAATTHKLKFFENGATPQLVVAYDASVTAEKFAKLKAVMDASHAGADNAYKTLFLGGGADVTVAGKDLHQLDFKVTQGAGESRLAAAAGVPPSIVGFSESLAGSSLNAGNYTAARRRFADATMRPLWREAAGALSTLVDVPAGAELWYDERDVAFLREDSKDAADIQGVKSRTIRQLMDAGFEPTSVVAAVEADDFALLKHTGLYSVQLQKPGTAPPGAGPASPPTEEQ
ncbi:phage portal protein [Streptomyces caniscabiei]|uniref:Phage portal protein n=1 Tax=Streptomyces caniscabiei TaxID=2746961 RepID=A0ABU4MMF7_9ACTN|nr:phage portal protein [Streptomyces caniscabiei]MBE4790910.1 phage portal protein [Streptomyces caniscabiei]MDX2953338.1 phage portal protein [Streptomyces caniscabiei]MDX2987325.1 phage portal protein [Streptomyces caniscabiei]MDX3009538.1 phage portal protein [Streptomyces caniscabiei]MDX3037183.1 phage portal protein [Streptomyces caniscabiei]